MNQHPPDRSAETARRQRASDYLLGEMNDAESVAYESELSDPQVAQALARESELLCRLACSDALQRPVRSVASLTAHSATPPSTLRSSFRLISGLAAVVLVALGCAFYLNALPRGKGDPIATASNDYQLAIAKNWATSTIEWSSIDWPTDDLAIDDELTETGDVDETRRSAEAGSRIADTDDEPSFDWMFAAVEASMSDQEGHNDG